MHEIHAKLALMKTSLAQEFYGTIRLQKKELDCSYYWGEQPQISLHSYCHDLFYEKLTWYEFQEI